MAQHGVAEDQIELPVGERKRAHIRHLEARVADSRGIDPGQLDLRRREIDTDDMPRRHMPGETQGDGARTAAAIEQGAAARKMGKGELRISLDRAPRDLCERPEHVTVEDRRRGPVTAGADADQFSNSLGSRGASGPSCASSANTGTNDKVIISNEKNSAGPTCAAASPITRHCSSPCNRSPGCA